MGALYRGPDVFDGRISRHKSVLKALVFPGTAESKYLSEFIKAYHVFHTYTIDIPIPSDLHTRPLITKTTIFNLLQHITAPLLSSADSSVATTTMDERLSRLQSLLGEDDVWESPAPGYDHWANNEDAHEDQPGTSYNSSDSDGYEKVVCISHLSGGDMDPRFLIGILPSSYIYPIAEELDIDKRTTVPEDEPFVPIYNLETGEIAATENKFVSLKALEKFTHKYVETANRNKVGAY